MSKIEWTDATWNPVTGCTKVSQGCKHCYAEALAKRFWGDRKFTDIRLHHDRLEQPLRWRKPRMVFVNSMSDLFHEDVPEHFIRAVFTIMARARQHTFQVLTKRPERMRNVILTWRASGLTLREGYTDHPLPNVWLGVSAEDQETASARVPALLDTPAAIRFVSYEPALGAVFFGDAGHHWLRGIKALGAHHRDDGSHEIEWSHEAPRLDWVIAGAESGLGARPADDAWFRSVSDECAAAYVPFFLKQRCRNGRKIPFDEWPDDLKVREWPEGGA